MVANYEQRAGCIKSYLNPNGLKYHLEKGTCIIDPLYRPPQPTTNSTANSNTSAHSNNTNAQAQDQKSGPLGSLPTPLLPVVKAEPSSPTPAHLSPLSPLEQSTLSPLEPYYYAYTFPFQYGTTAQIPRQGR